MSCQPLSTDRLTVTETWVKARRADVEEWLDRRRIPKTLSASRYLLHIAVTQCLREHVEGRVLEAGAGGSPFKQQLDRLAYEVVRTDIHDRYGDVDVIADVQDMPSVESGSFDVVVCTQVLEHVQNPEKALREMRRVLKDGGVLVLSAPHLSMVHEAPHDYFRFTRFGLDELSERSGFEVESVVSTGGLVAFILHPLSVALLTFGFVVQPLRWIIWAMNYVLLVRGGALLDRFVGASSLFPLDHVMVAVPANTAEV